MNGSKTHRACPNCNVYSPLHAKWCQGCGAPFATTAKQSRPTGAPPYVGNLPVASAGVPVDVVRRNNTVVIAVVAVAFAITCLVVFFELITKGSEVSRNSMNESISQARSIFVGEDRATVRRDFGATVGSTNEADYFMAVGGCEIIVSYDIQNRASEILVANAITQMPLWVSDIRGSQYLEGYSTGGVWPKEQGDPVRSASPANRIDQPSGEMVRMSNGSLMPREALDRAAEDYKQMQRESRDKLGWLK